MSNSGIALAAAFGLLVVGGGGWAMWNSTASAHRTAFASGIAIDVVAPREPDLTPGGVMTVGELNDHYIHDPERMEAADDIIVPLMETAWLEPDIVTPEPVVFEIAAAPTPGPARAPDLRPGDYRFGFDQPRPDYVAERTARRQRIEPATPAAAQPAQPIGDDAPLP